MNRLNRVLGLNLEAGLAAMTLLALTLAVAPAALAQDDDDEIKPGPWKYQAALGLNLSQSSFSNNWAGGDKGTAAWVLNGDFGAERQYNMKFNWSNMLQLAYGQTSTQKDDPDNPSRKVWGTPDKTTDLILLESVARFTLGGFVDPYAAFRLDSQFVDESNPLGDIMFNSIKLSQTAGVAKVFDKGEDHELISRFGFGFRESLSKTFTDATGDVTERFTTTDGGFEFQTQATYPMFEKKILYKGKLLVFLPVFFSQSSDLEAFDLIYQDPAQNPNLGAGDPTPEALGDFWKTPDVNWQNTFTAQITKIIAVNLYVQLVYDKFDSATNVDNTLDPAVLIPEVLGGVRKSGQFKQTLALGITYNLF